MWNEEIKELIQKKSEAIGCMLQNTSEDNKEECMKGLFCEMGSEEAEGEMNIN